MAGTRRPEDIEMREAFAVGAVLGFALGVIVGAFLMGL